MFVKVQSQSPPLGPTLLQPPYSIITGFSFQMARRKPSLIFAFHSLSLPLSSRQTVSAKFHRLSPFVLSARCNDLLSFWMLFLSPWHSSSFSSFCFSYFVWSIKFDLDLKNCHWRSNRKLLHCCNFNCLLRLQLVGHYFLRFTSSGCRGAGFQGQVNCSLTLLSRVRSCFCRLCTSFQGALTPVRASFCHIGS